MVCNLQDDQAVTAEDQDGLNQNLIRKLNETYNETTNINTVLQYKQ